MLPYASAMLMASSSGGAAPFANKGALVHITDNSSTALTSSTDISYGNIDYDVQGWRTSSTTFTTPTLPAGTLMRLFSSFYSSLATNPFERHLKGGAGFAGMGNGSCPPRAGSGAVWGAIIPAVAGEAFTTNWMGTNDTTQQDGRNWMGVEIIAPGTRYTFAQLASAQSVTSASGNKIMPWTHSIDTMGAHSNSVNTSRFTVPADTTGKVRITSNLVSNNAPGTAAESNLIIWKNGALFDCRDQVNSLDNVSHFHRVVSEIVDVVAGDYFEMTIGVNAGTLNYSAGAVNGWACFEELPASARYVLVNRATDLALSNGDNAIAWDGEIHDSDNCHDTSTNPADVVVPAGVTSARCSFAFDVTSGPTTLSWITRTRSGTTIKINGGGGSTANNSAVQNDGCGFGCWIDVQAGDILRLHINVDQASKSLKANALTWFQVEFE